MQHFIFVVPESILYFHTTSSTAAFQPACLVGALSPSRSTLLITSQGLVANNSGTTWVLKLSGNTLRREFLYLPYWRHPGQRGSTQCSEDNGPKLWTWRFFLRDSGRNSLLQQRKKEWFVTAVRLQRESWPGQLLSLHGWGRVFLWNLMGIFTPNRCTTFFKREQRKNALSVWPYPPSHKIWLQLQNSFQLSIYGMETYC